MIRWGGDDIKSWSLYEAMFAKEMTGADPRPGVRSHPDPQSNARVLLESTALWVHKNIPFFSRLDSVIFSFFSCLFHSRLSVVGYASIVCMSCSSQRRSREGKRKSMTAVSVASAQTPGLILANISLPLVHSRHHSPWQPWSRVRSREKKVLIHSGSNFEYMTWL